MSLRKKVTTVFGTAAASSLIAGAAAFGPRVLAWVFVGMACAGGLAFVLWCVWDDGYGRGWLDHSEGKVRP